MKFLRMTKIYLLTLERLQRPKIGPNVLDSLEASFYLTSKYFRFAMRDVNASLFLTLLQTLFYLCRLYIKVPLVLQF